MTIQPMKNFLVAKALYHSSDYLCLSTICVLLSCVWAPVSIHGTQYRLIPPPPPPCAGLMGDEVHCIDPQEYKAHKIVDDTLIYNRDVQCAGTCLALASKVFNKSCRIDSLT
ncbi:hypothetical protein SISNIDRAFT_453716 [Sistotremastrum niveocremeum HHB9708]|uniref:Uncharacterized protein n=1 Tax=Sistotremastrum niveocremeum HHB9708 TaxID=1314777 RepID=A0A164VBU3_9AGAM|nr:hypothetical protein SISNIDRAFT_453716 [Sistotremastrum niveocremeum HHB9708]